MAEEEQTDFTKLPIEERIQHKNWKARVSGYEQLVITFNQADDDKANEFTKYASLLKKAPVDTNITAQEKGLAAVSAFLNNANMTISAKIASDVISGCLSKSILQTRPKIKELNQEIILMYVELEKHQLVLDELIANFENKSPKIAVNCILYAREALKQFGPKIVKVSPIIKLLPVLLEHKDKSIREETRHLTIEIYRWIKDAMKPQISNLKPVILNELEEEFVKIKDERAMPTRFIRSEQAQVQKSATDDIVAEQDAPVAVADEVDPFEYIEAVEIISKLPANFYEQVEAKKWQDRKEAVDNVTNILEKVPKVAPGDFNELCKALKKIISKDANIVVVLSAAKCLAELARKLRKMFAPYSHGCVIVFIEKFKEKKQNVVQALRDAVDACLVSANFEAILEELTNYLSNKNPQIKQEVAQTISRYVKESKLDFLSNKKNIKTLTTALTKALNDMDSGVRDSSAECLGILMRAAGEKTLNPFISEVDPIKLAKIKEFYETSQVKHSVPIAQSATVSSKSLNDKAPLKTATSKSTLNSRPKTASSTNLSKKSSAISNSNKNLNGDSAASSQSTRPSTSVLTKSKSSVNAATTSKTRLLNKQPSVAKIETNATVKTLPLMTANGQKEQRFIDEKQLKLFKWNFTTPREEFFVELRELMQLAGWNASLISNCFNDDFKYHLKAIESINEFIVENDEAVLHNSDLIFKWIALRFFDTNPSVILKMFELLLKIFDVMKGKKILLNEIEAQNFIPYLILKSGDPKDVLRQKVHDVLSGIKDIYSPVKLYAYVAAGLNSKNSRQRTTCLDELSYFIKAYGTAVCQPSPTAACKEISKQIGDKDGAVRNAALNAIVEIYYFEGEKVLKILGNLNHKELDMLEKRLKRINRPTGPVIVKPLEATILIDYSAKAQHQQTFSPEPVEEEQQSQPTAPISQIGKLNNGTLPSNHNSKTLVKPRSALVRPGTKLGTVSNEIQQQQPQQQQHISTSQQHHQNSPPSAYTQNLHHTQQYNANRSPEPQTYIAAPSSLNPVRASAIKSRIATSLNQQQQLRQEQAAAAVQQQFKPIQLDFQDTDQEYNKLESKESRYSTYRTSTAYKASKSRNDEIDEILNESSILLPKRRTTFGIASPSNFSPLAGKSSASKSDKNLIKMLYANLTSPDTDLVIDSLNQMNEILNNQKHAAELLIDTINELIMRCSMQLCLVKTKYSKSEKDDTKVNNLFQHVMLTLYLVLKNSVLAKKITAEALSQLLPKAFDFLICKKLGSKLDDTVNNIIFLTLVNTDLTEIFLCIIRLLHRFIADDKNGKPSEQTDLTIKCFWKLTRIVEKVDQRINVSLILLELKNFLEAFPSHYWKSDPPKNEIAYRTIKTLIYILVKNKKQRIFLYMNKIPNKENTALFKLLKKAIDQVQEEDRNLEKKNDDLTFEELNYINDLLNRLQDELNTELFMQVIEFCDRHQSFNLREFMQEFHNEFFTNYVEEKLSELRATVSNGIDSRKFEPNGLGISKQNGHYSTNCKSTTEQNFESSTGCNKLTGICDQTTNQTINNHQAGENVETGNKKQNFGFDRSNLSNERTNLLELKRLPMRTEELNVENVQDWYLENMRALGADSEKTLKTKETQNSTDDLDEAVKESFRRTESILMKTKNFIEQHK